MSQRSEDEFHAAQAALKIAQQNFELADPQYIDIAVEELQIAESRLDVMIRKTKLHEGRPCNTAGTTLVIMDACNADRPFVARHALTVEDAMNSYEKFLKGAESA